MGLSRNIILSEIPWISRLQDQLQTFSGTHRIRPPETLFQSFVFKAVQDHGSRPEFQPVEPTSPRTGSKIAVPTAPQGVDRILCEYDILVEVAVHNVENARLIRRLPRRSPGLKRLGTCRGTGPSGKHRHAAAFANSSGHSSSRLGSIPCFLPTRRKAQSPEIPFGPLTLELPTSLTKPGSMI